MDSPARGSGSPLLPQPLPSLRVKGRGHRRSQGASERRGILWSWQGLSGLCWVRRNGRGPHLEGRQEPQASSPILTPTAYLALYDQSGLLPNRFLCSCNFPGENTRVGCHFLLQCMKVKGESEVAQSCPTLSDPMDCSPPGSFVHGIFQARVLEWVAISFSRGSS